jgi:hypothetical protein
MAFATLEEVAVWDEYGNVEGLQFDNRERRIQEWRERKEEREFAKLVESLQKRNAARKARQDPVKLERIKQHQRNHTLSGRRWKRERERRIEKYKADPVICRCQECGATWCVIYTKKSQKASKFCGKKCRMRFASVAASKRKNRGLRKMDVRQLIIDHLADNPATTADDIAAAIASKSLSTRSLCSRMAKHGELVSDGGKPARYSLTPTERA